MLGFNSKRIIGSLLSTQDLTFIKWKLFQLIVEFGQKNTKWCPVRSVLQRVEWKNGVSGMNGEIIRGKGDTLNLTHSRFRCNPFTSTIFQRTWGIPFTLTLSTGNDDRGRICLPIRSLQFDAKNEACNFEKTTLKCWHLTFFRDSIKFQFANIVIIVRCLWHYCSIITSMI